MCTVLNSPLRELADNCCRNISYLFYIFDNVTRSVFFIFYLIYIYVILCIDICLRRIQHGVTVLFVILGFWSVIIYADVFIILC